MRQCRISKPFFLELNRVRSFCTELEIIPVFNDKNNRLMMYGVMVSEGVVKSPSM